MSGGKRLFIKAALSLFIAYHVLCVSLLPNSDSIIGRKIGGFLTPYANLFIFNRTWQFFSPGPMPRFDLEYEVVTPESEMDVVRDTHVFPAKPDGFTLGDYYLRSLAGMRFLGVKEENFERFFIPWLCRQHPGATALDVRSVLEQIPPMESLLGDEETMGFADFAKRQDLPRRRYECQRISMKGDIDSELNAIGDAEASAENAGDGTGGLPPENDPEEALPGEEGVAK